jgi:soluble lytic murein transglycosylase-like protein
MFTADASEAQIRRQILQNNPRLKSKMAYVNRIAHFTVKLAKKHGIPAIVYTAIMSVESNYKLNAVNRHSNDYGIGQVSIYHIKRSKLSIRRLLTDLEYSIEQGMIIYKWFYKTYAKRSLNESIGRYNCGTAPSCPNWKVVRRYIRLVNSRM